MTGALPWPLITKPDGSLDVEAIQGNFDHLKDLVPDTGGDTLTFRFGIASVTFPGGTALSNQISVSHGLGKAPSVVVATGKDGSGQGVVATTTEVYTAATFLVRVQDVSGAARPAGWTVPVAWLAIG